MHFAFQIKIMQKRIYLVLIGLASLVLAPDKTISSQTLSLICL